MTVLAEVAAGACALLFLAAVLGKLDSWGQWSRLSKEIPGPVPLGRVVRVAVPVIESAVVVLSFAVPIAGLAAGALLLAGFAVAVSLLARRLSGHECNCFGAIAPATISSDLARRNVALAILLAAGWYVADREHLESLTVSVVLLTASLGAITLMALQYERLRHTPLPDATKEA